MSIIPVAQSPELIIASVAPRPRGGSRRAAGPAVVKAPRTTAAPERCANHFDGMIVDAFDAALFIGSHCRIWQSEQILAHIELVQMAVMEATTYLRGAISALGWRGYATLDGRRQMTRLNAELEELGRCARILFDAHTAGLIEVA